MSRFIAVTRPGSSFDAPDAVDVIDTRETKATNPHTVATSYHYQTAARLAALLEAHQGEWDGSQPAPRDDTAPF